MMLLPLQSLWAAVELYHVHVTAEESTGIVDVVHDHHGHDHSHATPDSTESDHHHHCTGHIAVVLPAAVGDLRPDLRYDEFSSVPVLSTSHLYSRIERPNWC